MKRIISLVLVALTLNACAAVAVDPLTPDEKNTYHLENVQINASSEFAEAINKHDNKILEDNPSSGTLETVLTKAIKQELNSGTFNGPRNANIVVTITSYRAMNSAMALLLGDTGHIFGNVLLTDSANGKTLGEFNVKVAKGAAGPLGMALSGGKDPRDDIAMLFAKDLARQMEL